MMTCCCQPYDEERHLITRCLVAAFDLGHCTTTDHAQPWCCGGGDLAKVQAIVAARWKEPT